MLVPAISRGGVLKSATFNGTTDSSTGDFNFNLSADVGVIVAVRETHNYNPVTVITSSMNNFGQFFARTGMTTPLKNTAVSGNYYYIEVE